MSEIKTPEAKDLAGYLKYNWISFSTLIVLLGFIVHQSKWQESVDNHMIEFVKHENNKTFHMPFKEKIDLFVPRIELDNRLKNIEELLKDIKQSQK